MDRGRLIIIGAILALLLLAKGVGKPQPETGQFAPFLATPTPTTSPVDELKKLAISHSIQPKVVAAVIEVESQWRPEAKGTSGEVGLMQLMPATAKAFGVADRLDPFANVKGGIAYLAYCKQKTGELYLRCYNAGEKGVHLPAAKKYEKKVLAAIG
jgi:soluble lytic murein transglycosylase-like protein